MSKAMKILFVTAAACMLAAGAHAQKVTIVSGDVGFLKNEKQIEVRFTYDNMQVGGMPEADYVAKKVSDAEAKKPGSGDAWHRAWIHDRSARFEPKFIELFNKYIGEKGGVLLNADNVGGKYLMTVNTHFTEPGFNVGVARKNSSVSMKVTFTDAETGNAVAVMNITNSSANSAMGFDYDVAFRIQESYAKAGRGLAKFLIKKLKLK
jgi:hypothetical protein